MKTLGRSYFTQLYTMNNTYIQDKLDELVETYRRTTVIYEKQNGDEVKEKVNSYFTEYDARMIAERLVADYHNHIVEKIEKIDTPLFEGASGFSYNAGWNDSEKSSRYHLKAEILSLLQDTNPKE